MESSRGGIAVQKHKNGYNCAQAVVCTYSDVLGVTEEQAFKAFEGFGFGMCGLQEVCGAVSGMIAVLGGLNSGGNDAQSFTKADTYRKGRALAEKFRQKNGTYLCRELLGGKGAPKLRSCNGCILDACRIVEQELFAGEFLPYEGEEY